MASTSVHFPKGLLDRLDVLASQLGVSRNKLVVQACEELLEQQRREWPPDFFGNEDLSDEDLAELRAVGDSFLRSILDARHSKTEAPF